VGGRGGDETDARELIAEAGDAGLRLDAFLVARGAFPSRAAAQRAIELGHVSADDTDRPKNFRIEEGARIRIDPSSHATPVRDGGGIDFAVVYEDPHLMVVDKPAGVVAHPAPGHAGVTLAEVLPPGSRLVHRLDKDTSGLLVVARSEEARAALQGMMKARDVTREYLALIEGHPDAETGTIDAPIGRDRANRTVMSTRSDRPREAVTHFEVVERLPRTSLLRVTLETGRTHQIRAHLAAIGHPVVGDPRYRGMRSGARLGLDRQFLHASSLMFRHPFTREWVRCESKPPVELSHALDTARREPVSGGPDGG
jgi:23S rRNA pseudouridine1911/1915/1917 synthase